MDNNIALELTKVLTRAETEFGLNEVLERNGIPTSEPVTVEVTFGDELLLRSQIRYFDSSNKQHRWVEAEEQRMENPDITQESDAGAEIVEVLNRSELLPSLKRALQSNKISEDNPVIVTFNFGNFIVTSLKCPCSNQPCCKVGG